MSDGVASVSRTETSAAADRAQERRSERLREDRAADDRAESRRARSEEHGKGDRVDRYA